MSMKRVTKRLPDAYCVALQDKALRALGHRYIVWSGPVAPRGSLCPAIGIGRTAREAWSSTKTFSPMSKTTTRIHVKKRATLYVRKTRKQHYWRITTPNNKKIAIGGEGYKNQGDIIAVLPLVLAAIQDYLKTVTGQRG